jgi:hypothetical protein
MAHTQTETQPRKRPKMSGDQRAYVAHDQRWPEHRRKLASAQEAKRMTLFDNEVAAIVALRRKGRTFSYIAEEIGVCSDMIGRELRTRGMDTRPVKPDRRARPGAGFLAVLRRVTTPPGRPDDRQADQEAWWVNAGAVNRLSHRGACQSRRVGLLRRRSPVCLVALGHTVRLIPPQYVKPFVKRGKNDRNDAEAICEAAGRPGMRSSR